MKTAEWIIVGLALFLFTRKEAKAETLTPHGNQIGEALSETPLPEVSAVMVDPQLVPDDRLAGATESEAYAEKYAAEDLQPDDRLFSYP